jgi:NADH-quinone oxidoreductase subunit M
MINLGLMLEGCSSSDFVRRQRSTAISAFSGWAKRVPFLALTFLIIALPNAAPGTNVFVSEFLVLAGAFKAPLYAVISVIGVVLGAAYILFLYGRVMLGNGEQPRVAGLLDLNRREAAIGIILMILIIFLGPSCLC